MPIPRRNFMQLFGISLGSMLLARCQRTGTPEVPGPPTIFTCYEAVAPSDIPSTPTPTPASLAFRARLRLCWLRFGELAQKTRDAATDGSGDWDDNALGTQMNADHRSVLDGLVSAGEITPAVADLLQEAYAAAVFHIWRSNAPITCYLAAGIEYAPASASDLVLQADALNQIASGTPLPEGTLGKIRTALEHDLAFYALTDAEVQALYEQLLAEYSDPGESLPSFEELELTLTPDVLTAAGFLLDVLMGR